MVAISESILRLSEAQPSFEHVLEDELERISDGFVVLDRAWRYRYVNRAAEEYIGLPREQLLGKVMWELFPAAVGTSLHQQLTRAAAGVEPVEFEIASAIFARRVACKAFPSAAGVSFHFRDVSAQKKVEATLRESESRFRSVVENSIEGILLTAPTGEIFAANPAACRMLGRTEEELCQAGRIGVADPDDPRVAEFVEERQRTGRAGGELTMLRKDGSRFTARVSSSIFRDASGAERTSITFHDRSERKRAEVGLRLLAKAGTLATSLDREQTLRQLVELVVPEQADFCMVDLLQDGALVRVAVAHRDPAQAALLPPVRRRMGPRAQAGTEAVLRTMKPELIPVVTEAWLVAATRDPSHLEAARRIGTTSWLSVPMLARGKAVGVLTLGMVDARRSFGAEDVPLAEGLADRAAQAIENARLYTEAIEARALRDEMLGIVSHDLRNPLHSIDLCASVLQAAGDNRELSIIRRAVQRADRLISDLLTTAAIDAGRLPLAPRDEPVAELVAEVLEMHVALARERSIALTSSVEDGVASAFLDRHAIVQLLSNLLGNALKFTPEAGRVSLRVRVAEGRLELVVADTGPGIPAEQMEHLFERFWQGTNARRAGAGLGLAIVKGIAEAHGGTVTVESRLGEGTTFLVSLPTAPRPAGSDAPRALDAGAR